MPQAKNLRAVSDRIEGLLAEVRAIGDPRARETAEELARLLVELYGAGLERMLAIAGEAGAGEMIDRFAADDLVASLLILHGLHPQDAASRIAAALERVRPHLGSHGGDVRFLGVEDGVARLRLEGNCHGCPSSTITMKLAIERAIEEAAPEVVRIEVEGVAAAPEAAPAVVDSVVQIGQIGLQCPSELEAGRG
ncbi:MAG TPA: NifU family protein [Thermoanaerobaculia bacterium]